MFVTVRPLKSMRFSALIGKLAAIVDAHQVS
jgi:hypothetical protein